MGQKFQVGIVTADMLNDIGQPVKGHTIESAGATSGTTESIYITSPVVTPEPNTWYRVVAMLNWTSSAGSQGFWHRIRDNNLAGTELTVGRLDVVSSGGPYESMIGAAYFAGASPSAVQFVGTLQRFGGTGTATPNQCYIDIIQCGGINDFTS